MIRSRRFLLLPVMAVFFLAGMAMATEVMPLSEIKPGMKGKGRSVFAGAKVEEFDVEILGILENVQPGRNIILARLAGCGLESTGIISGMSGSPVYIDGKLIGAVAYGFSFSKDPVCGLTPIGEMLAIEKTPAAAGRTSPGLSSFDQSLNRDNLIEMYRKEFNTKALVRTASQPLAPLAVPLYFSGFSPWAFKQAGDFFAPLGFRPFVGGTTSGGQLKGLEFPAMEKLQEGGAVGVQLIGGDLDLSAVGTVTYVDGNRVLAFGHPFYNLGSVDYAMTSPNVITVLASLESSAKLASAGPVIGTFTQDRVSGAVGEVGKKPRFVPLKINLMTAPGVSRDFNLNLINDRFLTAALINMAVSSLVTSEQRSYGNLSLEFDATVYLDQDGISIKLEDLFSGNYDQAATNLSSLVASVAYYVVNNDFRDVGIYRIDLNVRALEETRFCFLEKVLLDKYEVSPGEQIHIKVSYRTYREESRTEEVTLISPPLPAGTEFQIVIGDAATMQQVERSQYRVQEFMPRSFSQLVRILNNLRKNNRIYFKVVASKPGIFLRGEEMPNLPPSLKAMFLSSRASAAAPIELTRSTLGEYQLQIPFVFQGGAVIPVKIKK